jgi:hypothetical protein
MAHNINNHFQKNFNSQETFFNYDVEESIRKIRRQTAKEMTSEQVPPSYSLTRTFEYNLDYDFTHLQGYETFLQTPSLTVRILEKSSLLYRSIHCTIRTLI